jgi:DNA-binding ferritin-like protein
MDKCSKIAALHVASLRAISLIHQHNHWTSKGKPFYGDHLLFERIYKTALDDMDLAAEKFIGLFGEDCMNYVVQTDLLNKVLLKYKSLDGKPLEQSLAIEKDFLKFSKDAYNCFEEEGALTLGLDDMLMTIANNREGAVYLLQQPLKEAFHNTKLRKRAVIDEPPHQDETIKYLIGAIPIAAANVGINNVVVSRVEKHPAVQTGAAQIDDTYTAFVTGIPPKQAESFKKSWDKQLAAQKPDLVGRVGFILT